MSKEHYTAIEELKLSWRGSIPNIGIPNLRQSRTRLGKFYPKRIISHPPYKSVLNLQKKSSFRSMVDTFQPKRKVNEVSKRSLEWCIDRRISMWLTSTLVKLPIKLASSPQRMMSYSDAQITRFRCHEARRRFLICLDIEIISAPRKIDLTSKPIAETFRILVLNSNSEAFFSTISSWLRLPPHKYA